MIRIKKFLTNPVVRFGYFSRMGLYNKMNDEKYLKKKYKLIFHKELDLENPKTFNEKLQWLKLHDRKPEYSMMVDKYEAKKYVASIIGEEHIIPTLGVWERFEDIDFSKLPDQFVLKTTHDSGSVIVCTDKAAFDAKNAKRRIKKSLKRNYYLEHREWAYKNVKRRILVEKYIYDEHQNKLIDYKFYCFNGEPKFLYISEGSDNHNTMKMCYLGLDWNPTEFQRNGYKPFKKLPGKPDCFEEMITIAKTLSKNTSFLRVDLYEVNSNVYFSELTFYPTAGYANWNGEKYDYQIGTLLKL